jgi:hypothetical protein
MDATPDDASPSSTTSNNGPPRTDDRDIPSFEAERVPRWLVLAVPVAAAVVAIPGLGGQLLSDDYPLLYGNRILGLEEMLQTFLRQSSSLAAGGTYRPLTEISIGLDYLIWGTNPFGFHLVNLLWHVVCSLLCYLFVRVLVPPRPVVALTAGLLFAVHPVHGDAIFWIAARSDLLCTAFYLVSLILFVRGKGPEQRRLPTTGSVLAFCAALLSKEVAVSLPALVVILDLAAPSATRFRSRLRAHLPRYLVYAAAVAAYVALRYAVLPTLSRAQFPGLLESLFNLGLYVKLLMMPIETRTGLRGVVVMVLFVIVLLVTFLRYARMGDRRNMALGFAWILTIIAPMVDIPRRWQLYLPSVGFCVFFAIVLAGLTWRRDTDHPRWLSRTSGLGLLSLLLAGGGLMFHHATVYRQAGDQAQSIVSQVRRHLPRPGHGQAIYVANLPSVLTSWTGDQPVFAFGSPEAIKLAYGREDLEVRVLSTLYIRGDQMPRPKLTRAEDGQLQLQAGGGAYAFSFHESHFTTGRDRPVQGQRLDYDAWTTVIERVEDQRITAMRIEPKPGGPTSRAVIFSWDGERIRRVGE